jgi:hypothetical protein
MDGGPTLLENMTTLGMLLSNEQTHAGPTLTQELMIVISNLTSYVSYGVGTCCTWSVKLKDHS